MENGFLQCVLLQSLAVVCLGYFLQSFTLLGLGFSRGLWFEGLAGASRG